MAEPFLGEVRIMSFNYPPRGWAFCNGQLLPINQNQALFSLLGTMYGGNGQTTFALPNFQGRLPVHLGSGLTQGQAGGEVSHTLTTTEMPAHSHLARAGSGVANQLTGAAGLWANGGQPAYSSAAPNAAMRADAVTSVGGSQPHNNMSPYLVLNFCIALSGIFPSRT
jgi:microcystin-dependent protein